MEVLEKLENNDEALCLRCQALDLSRYLVEEDNPDPTALGGFQEIAQRENCTFCRLVICALSAHSSDHWQKKIYPVEKCYLGRTRGNTGTCRLITWFDATSSTLPPGHFGHITTYGEILFASRSFDQQQKLQAGLARHLDESRADFSLIQSWIKSCEDSHGPDCTSELNEPIHIRLLDLQRMCLVDGYQTYRYFALSYVWGDKVSFQTLRSNINNLEEDGSISRLRDQFPQVINDAISFVSAIQERYLWVDALCIVQDDARDKDTHIPHMNTIYGQATATIVSLFGHDASAGIPGIGAVPRRVRQPSLDIGPWRLSAKLPELSDIVQRSKWDTRAWTFQEGIVSRRCIFISEHQAYFQCRKGYYTEETYGDQTRQEWEAGFSNPFNLSAAENADAGLLSFTVYNNLVNNFTLETIDDAQTTTEGVILPPNGYSVRDTDWCWTSWSGHVHWDPWRTTSYAGREVSLKQAIDCFVIARPDGIEGICERKKDSSKNAPEDTLRDAMNYFDKHKDSLNHTDTGSRRAWEVALLFKSYAADLSRFSIIFNDEPYGNQEKATNWRTPLGRLHGWLCDSNGRHCGTLYGLRSAWTESHDPSRCELVLLSSFSQEEVTPADIHAHQASLPLEYPSSDEYYSEVFDTTYYKYIDGWAQNVMLVEWSGNLS